MFDHIEITVLNIELYSVGREWNYRNVSNPYSRIYYIKEGNAIIQHHNQKHQLLPGHLYLIPCYTTVNLFCPDRFTHYYVHFTSRLQTGLDILTIFECSSQAEAEASAISESLFERLLELNPNKELTDYDANKPIYQQVLDRAIRLDQNKSPANILETNAIIRTLLSVFFKEVNRPQIADALQGLKRFENVLEYIHDHLNTPLTISQLAEIANLNPTYFSNLFSKLIGSPPLQYINKRRIEKAQELLLGTNDTLYRIARQIGFSDEYYFSRLFKKIVGISPDYYRKQEHIIHRR